MLGPLPCGQGSPWRPFSRSYGAILPSSLAMLLPPALGSSPCPPVSVCGTGTWRSIAAFLGTRTACFATPIFAPRRGTGLSRGAFPPRGLLRLRRALRPPAHAPRMRPHSSAATQYRNLRLSSIGYALRPRLRPRLPQGRTASPWKPWASGRGDSHPPLATHSGILPSCRSTPPHGRASLRQQCSPTGAPACAPRLRRHVSAPGIFGAGPLDQ